MKGFTNCNIYVEGLGIVKTSLEIKDGMINKIGEFAGGIVLPDNLYVIPGFVDQHVHGGNHSDAMYPTQDDILNISKTVATEGVTSFLATTMTQSEENIIKALKNINTYIENQYSEGAQVLGIHLEGPFISKKFKGAQPEEYIIPCDVETYKRYEKASGGHIKIVTLAYEENGKELTKYLVKNNVVVSLGHTDATAKDVYEAVENGATCATHCYNAMKSLHHREAGTVGGSMLSDEMYCELISDLIHVCPDAIKILFKLKGKDKMILITDGMEAKHLSDGDYKLGGQTVHVVGKEARLDSGNLAGSTLFMNEAVRNIKNVMDLSMEDAIDLATMNPAKNINVFDKKGSIKIGKDADFVIVDKDFNIYETIRGGVSVYKK
ncbi:MAG TPA: N-acetylglucosamine-6-phosphate deacetylase [Acholeplasmataceae bacterium]|nr:N-acetylglucosamine-6-phosphate deacetylase [Acholeplasmataceae bacterium]